jgi:hypothetical protein
LSDRSGPQALKQYLTIEHKFCQPRNFRANPNTAENKWKWFITIAGVRVVAAHCPTPARISASAMSSLLNHNNGGFTNWPTILAESQKLICRWKSIKTRRHLE